MIKQLILLIFYEYFSSLNYEAFAKQYSVLLRLSFEFI